MKINLKSSFLGVISEAAAINLVSVIVMHFISLVSAIISTLYFLSFSFSQLCLKHIIFGYFIYF